jgi:hypothetical protein
MAGAVMEVMCKLRIKPKFTRVNDQVLTTRSSYSSPTGTGGSGIPSHSFNGVPIRSMTFVLGLRLMIVSLHARQSMLTSIKSIPSGTLLWTMYTSLQSAPKSLRSHPLPCQQKMSPTQHTVQRVILRLCLRVQL